MTDLEKYIEHLKKEKEEALNSFEGYNEKPINEYKMVMDYLIGSAEEFNEKLKRPFMGSNAE